MHPVETYLTHLARIHSTGAAVPETSYYAALENLLNEIGKKLKPEVRCVSQLKNTGAGTPDFGLYTSNQFQRSKNSDPIPGVSPERGVIEVKGWGDDSFLRAKGAQVSKYWDKYGLVLVTNYRDFVLVGRDDSGKPVQLESYRIAESESEFLDKAAHPRKTAQEQGDRFVDFRRLNRSPVMNEKFSARKVAESPRKWASGHRTSRCCSTPNITIIGESGVIPIKVTPFASSLFFFLVDAFSLVLYYVGVILRFES